MVIQRLQSWKPSQGEKAPLEPTGKCLGGLRQDLRRRARCYLSDWTDAFKPANQQKTLSTVLFLFFACYAPAITFGLLFDEGSNGSFGVVEMIMSSGYTGIVYSIFAGQPLAILGATGPILAYTNIFYSLTQGLGLEFLPCYFWCGIWFSLITIFMAVFDVCCLMRYVTKFTEEIFSGLISMIFIVEAIKPAIKAFYTKDLAVALLQLNLLLGTYGLAMKLAKLKTTNLLNFTFRKVLSNFAVTIAILTFSAIASIWADRDIDMLHVPSDFRPTYEDPVTKETRGWFIHPMGKDGDLPIWAIFWCILPALGFAVLGFLDQNLTTLLVNRRTNGLQKPPAYHLDLLVCGVLIYPVCSILGLPFPVAATVRSLTHLISLTNYDIQEIKGGGQRKVPTGVAEQRFTNLGIHTLILLSLALAPMLKYLPQAVLLGVFLFMGVSSLNGNELYERLTLWSIWDTAKYPQYPYLQKVAFKRVHMFTFIQALGLGVLYALKSIKEVAVVFPFFIAFLAIIRPFFGKYFTEDELKSLDGDEDEDQEEQLPISHEKDKSAEKDSDVAGTEVGSPPRQVSIDTGKPSTDSNTESRFCESEESPEEKRGDGYATIGL
jgi:hypothetical protein